MALGYSPLLSGACLPGEDRSSLGPGCETAWRSPSFPDGDGPALALQGPKRPHKHEDFTFWFPRPMKGGYQKSWSVGFLLLIIYHTIPYYTRLYHTIPYPTLPYPTIPYHTIPCHTIPYHTMPYHTIPYHTYPTIPFVIRYYKDMSDYVKSKTRILMFM